MMKYIKSIIIFSFLISISNACHTNAQSAQSHFGLKDFKCCWQFKDMPYESGGPHTEEDVQKIAGTLICFDKDTIDMLGDTITEAKYTIKKERTDIFTFRNFQVDQNINKWFKITTDSVYTIKLSGKYNSEDSMGNPRQSHTENELAYDGKYLYLADGNGALFRLTKYIPDNKMNVGTGSAVKEFVLTGKEHTLNLSYEFYTDPDEIIVYDQTGKELYHSGMRNTKQEETVNIKLGKVTKLTVKIKSKSPDSRWAFGFETKK